jgi:hypothetical protein
MKFLSLLRDIIVYSTVVLRRNTLCKMGIHKLVDEVETLALGEKLIRPRCSVFKCGYADNSKARLEVPNDGKDGTLFAMNHTDGRLVNYGRVKEGELRKAGIFNRIFSKNDYAETDLKRNIAPVRKPIVSSTPTLADFEEMRKLIDKAEQ